MFDMGWSFEIIVFKGHSDVKNILDTTYAELEINTTDFNDFNTLIVLRQKCTSKRFLYANSGGIQGGQIRWIFYSLFLGF